MLEFASITFLVSAIVGLGLAGEKQNRSRNDIQRPGRTIQIAFIDHDAPQTRTLRFPRSHSVPNASRRIILESHKFDETQS